MQISMEAIKAVSVARTPRCARTLPARQPIRTNAPAVVTSASSNGQSEALCSRREALLSLGALVAASQFAARPAFAARGTDAVPVGQYLPSAGNGLVNYKPDEKKTPAIRAGVIKGEPDYYSFQLPENFSEARISNTLTGNFCMPRCDEPWVEAQFNGEGGSKVQLWVVETFRLISKANATLADIGAPRLALNSIGSYITGSDPPEDENILTAATVSRNGTSFYSYEIDGASGHHLASLCVKNQKAYLFIATLGKSGSRALLQKVVDSFKP